LITKPSAARLDSFLAQRLREKGVSQGDFVKKLEDCGIIIRKTKVDDGLGQDGTGKPSYSITYKVPAERFEHKLKKLHISLFEENLPEDVITEEGGCATSCAFDGAGQFIQPMNGGKDESAPIIRHTIYMTEDQFNNLMDTIDEATTTTNSGNYQYDVPFPIDSDDPTMKHNKGKKHGSAENAIGMDRLTESGGYDMSTPEGREGARKWMNSMMSQEDPTGGYADQWVSNNAPDYPDISWDDCYERMKRAFIAGVEYGRQYE
jgi:hypothetical protein